MLLISQKYFSMLPESLVSRTRLGPSGSVLSWLALICARVKILSVKTARALLASGFRPLVWITPTTCLSSPSAAACTVKFPASGMVTRRS